MPPVQLSATATVARFSLRMRATTSSRASPSVELIERTNARFDVGFAEAGGAQVAREETLVAGNSREARANFGFEDGFEFVRDAGKQHDDVTIFFEPQCRGRAAWIWENRGAFGDHGLALIYFGHGTREPAEAFLNFAHDGFF